MGCMYNNNDEVCTDCMCGLHAVYGAYTMIKAHVLSQFYSMYVSV